MSARSRMRRDARRFQYTNIGTDMPLASLIEWELGARAAGDLLSENESPTVYSVLMQRFTRAWPIFAWQSIVGKVITLNIKDDHDLYVVKSIDPTDNRLICDQLTYTDADWPGDGTLKEWAIDPDSIDEAVDWDKVGA